MTRKHGMSVEERRAAAREMILDNRRRKAAFAAPTLLAASKRMKNILLQECRAKHLLDPRENGVNPDYHIEVTIAVKELRAFANAVNKAANGRDQR